MEVFLMIIVLKSKQEEYLSINLLISITFLLQSHLFIQLINFLF